jgi:hypothetical protein
MPPFVSPGEPSTSERPTAEAAGPGAAAAADSDSDMDDAEPRPPRERKAPCVYQRHIHYVKASETEVTRRDSDSSPESDSDLVQRELAQEKC